MRPANEEIRVERQGFGPISCRIGSCVSERKRRGLFFTPWTIARCLARAVVRQLSLKSIEAPPLAIDPFAGAGVLLAAWTEELAGSLAEAQDIELETVRTRVLGQVFGVDIEEHMPGLCARVLGGGDRGLADSIRPRLKVMDALTAPLEPRHGRDRSWTEQFPEVFRRGGFDVVLANPPWEKALVNDREFFTHYQPSFSGLDRVDRDRCRERLLEDPAIRREYESYRDKVARLKGIVRTEYATAGSGGDLDTYKLAVERCLALAAPGGFVGLVVPQGILGDWGARKLRWWILENHTLLEITRFQTGPQLFPEIHANLGVVLLVLTAGKGQPRSRLHLSSTIRTQADLARPRFLDLPVSVVKESTPHLMIPLVECRDDGRFLESCRAFPALADWPRTQFKPRREVDMTNDRQLFREAGETSSPESFPWWCPAPTGSSRDRGEEGPSPGEQAEAAAFVPLLEGKHLAPYCLPVHRWRFEIPNEAARHGSMSRIAWRAVADRAMSRRLVAAWVPPSVALGNSLHFTGCQEEDGIARLLWLLAWMNSRVADAQLRLWCPTNNINMFHLLACRLPTFEPSPGSLQVVGWAAGVTAYYNNGYLPGSLLAMAEPLRSTRDCLDALEAIECHFQRRYDLDDVTWRRAVLERTTSVRLGSRAREARSQGHGPPGPRSRGGR